MTLLGDVGAELEWGDLERLAPDGVRAIVTVLQDTYARVDPGLLELARIRITQLLRCPDRLRSEAARHSGLSEDKVARIPQWFSDPAFTQIERTCLELTEQFIIDVNGITDEQVEEISSLLSPAECLAFVSGLWALEQLHRVCAVTGAGLPPEALEPSMYTS